MRPQMFVRGGLAAAAWLTATASAFANVTHVVQPGHTLEAIAHRYRVSEQAIIEANHLKDARHLKPGQTLIIPGVEPPRKGEASTAAGDAHGPSGDARARWQHDSGPRGRPVRGVVELLRGRGEDVRVRVRDSRGHVPAAALEAFERIMRQGGETHPPDARLVALVGVVSDHFAGKPLQVLSGYRAYTPTQYTPHSNHNYGKALDFTVTGVDNVTLYEFCLTLRNVGCGYYPNSGFVHLDVRESKAHWIDRSGPGEPPQYDRPAAPADEARGDVPGASDPRSSPVTSGAAAPAVEPRGDASAGDDARVGRAGNDTPGLSRQNGADGDVRATEERAAPHAADNRETAGPTPGNDGGAARGSAPPQPDSRAADGERSL